jgi:hypothetical protein
MLGMSIWLVVYVKMGIAGVFYAQIISSFVAMIFCIFLLRKWISLPRIDIPRWISMFKFSAPMLPGSVAYWIINLSGAYFIQRIMKNEAEVGLFNLGYMISTAMAVLTSAFTMAWGPFAYNQHNLNAEKAKKIFASVFYVFSVAAGFILFSYVLLVPEVIVLFTKPGYYSADVVAVCLGINPVLIAYSYIAAIGTGIAKNNLAYGIGMIVSAVLLIGLNYLLIPQYGKVGASLSIIISQLITPLVVFWHAQKLYPIPYQFLRGFLWCFVPYFAAIIIFMTISNRHEISLLHVGLKFILITTYALFLWRYYQKKLKQQIQL